MAERRIQLDVRKHLPSAVFVGVVALMAAGVAGAVIYAGVYDIGADTPHMRPTYWLIENLRDRSIAVRARNISLPPDFNNPKRIASGAALYAEMCSGCHLAPGGERTEISQGLYPQAPELSRGSEDSPAEQFWTIKHGVKLTAMPAWGRTHSDELIWDLVAFIRTLPNLTPEQYNAIAKSAPGGHDAAMRDMPGTAMKGAATEPHGGHE